MELSSVPTDAELMAWATQVASDVQRERLMLATAESCTGGWIAKALTDLAGSSAWFEGGIVSYSNEVKATLLGVRQETLERFGAVSEETVLEMVSGALERFGAGVAVAVTGIAGPTGGSPEKPVGTVWVGWKRRDGQARAKLFQFAGDREAVRRQTVAEALIGVRETLTS
ncbi:CinA family protein [Dyella caseinilytica]|uniref:CinA family protein n=1 Tax=Dyella caseinilytica TaxID=1849581 RepID=A0ABX7GQU1_9GAMM|nr:CinA family protein [Dyella caseinilytica]QRN52438.1 CinA family protein [Dyella caseinilytica]GGA06020.1 competence damage-inducible protein A [Dyella caseinilytica]